MEEAIVASVESALCSRQRVEASVASVSQSLKVSDEKLRDSLARLIVATGIVARRDPAKDDLVQSAVLCHFEKGDTVSLALSTLEAPGRLALSGGRSMRVGSRELYVRAAAACAVEDAGRDARAAVRVMLEPLALQEKERRREALVGAMTHGAEFDEENNSLEVLERKTASRLAKSALRIREELCCLALEAALAVEGRVDLSACLSLVGKGDKRSSRLAVALSAMAASSDEASSSSSRMPPLVSLCSSRPEIGLQRGALKDLKKLCEEVPEASRIIDAAILRKPEIFDVRLFYDDEPALMADGRFAVDLMVLATAWKLEGPPDSLVSAAAGVFPFEPRPLLRLAAYRDPLSAARLGGTLSRVSASTQFYILRDDDPGPVVSRDTVEILELDDTVVVVSDESLPRGCVGRVVLFNPEEGDLVVRWPHAPGSFFDVTTVAEQFIEAGVDDELVAVSARALARTRGKIERRLVAQLAHISEDQLGEIVIDAFTEDAARDYVTLRGDAASAKLLKRTGDADRLVALGALRELSELKSDHDVPEELLRDAFESASRSGGVLAADARLARSVDDRAAFAAELVRPSSRSAKLIASLLAVVLKDETRSPKLAPALASALSRIAAHKTSSSSRALSLGRDFFDISPRDFFKGGVVFVECATSLARRAPDLVVDLFSTNDVKNAALECVGGGGAARDARTVLAGLALAFVANVDSDEWRHAVAKTYQTFEDSSSVANVCRTLEIKAHCLKILSSSSSEAEDVATVRSTELAVDALLSFQPSLLDGRCEGRGEFGEDEFLAVASGDESTKRMNATASKVAASISFFSALSAVAPPVALDTLSKGIADDKFAALAVQAASGNRIGGLLMTACALDVALYFHKVPTDATTAAAFLDSATPLFPFDRSLRKAALVVAVKSLLKRGAAVHARERMLARVDDDDDDGFALAAACLKRPVPHRLVASALRLRLPERALKRRSSRATTAFVARCAGFELLARRLVDANVFEKTTPKISAAVLGTLSGDGEAWRRAIHYAAASTAPLEESVEFYAALSMRADAWILANPRSCAKRLSEARAMACTCDSKKRGFALAICRRISAAKGVAYFSFPPDRGDKVDRGVFCDALSLKRLVQKLYEDDEDDDKEELVVAVVASILDHLTLQQRSPASSSLASRRYTSGRQGEYEMRSALDHCLFRSQVDADLLRKLQTLAKPLLDLPPTPSLHHRSSSSSLSPLRQTRKLPSFSPEKR